MSGVGFREGCTRSLFHGRTFSMGFKLGFFSPIFSWSSYGAPYYPLLITGFPGPALLRDYEAYHDPFSFSRDHYWGRPNVVSARPGKPRQWKMDSKPLGVPIHTKPQQVNFWSHPCHPEKGIHVFVGEKILPKKFLANGPTIDLLDNND